jgi:hypothetical protein
MAKQGEPDQTRHQEVCPIGATYNKALRVRRAFFILLASYSSAIQVLGDTVRDTSNRIFRFYRKDFLRYLGKLITHH